MSTEVATLTPDQAAAADHTVRVAGGFVTVADAFAIAEQSDYDLALSELRSIKQHKDKTEKDRLTFTGPLNAVLNAINARFMPAIKLCEKAEATIKAKMTGYLQEQKRLEAEARRTADEAAAAERQRMAEQAAVIRRAAEAEQARAEAEARHVREAAELEAAQARGKAAKAAAERRAAEAREQEERERLAASERAALASQQADAIEATAAIVMAPAVAPTYSKGAGISTPTTFDFEVVDLLALARYIATERPDLVVLLAVESAKLRALVKMMGASTNLPGVRVFPKTGITVR